MLSVGLFQAKLEVNTCNIPNRTAWMLEEEYVG